MFKINSILFFFLVLLSGCNIKLGNSGKNPNSSAPPSSTAQPSLNRSPVLDCSSVVLINCDSTAGCKSYDTKCYTHDEALSKQAAKDKIAEIKKALIEVNTKVTKVTSSVDPKDVNDAITDLKKSQTGIEQAIPKTKALIDLAVRDAADKITALKNAQATFISKHTALEEAKNNEAKAHAAALITVTEEEAKVNNALTELTTATTVLDKPTILTIQSVKTAKEELDKHKNALDVVINGLNNAKPLNSTGITNTLNSLNIANKIKSLETAQAAFIQAYGEEKTRIEDAEKEEARKKTEAVNKVKEEQEKIKNALTASNTVTTGLNKLSILNAKSVKDAKTDLDAKKTVLDNLNQTLENAKKLATAGAITAAFNNVGSSAAKITELKDAQEAFIQAYNLEKNKIEDAEKEEARKKTEAVNKVKEEQEKIKNALDALATAMNGLKNTILNAQSVQGAQAELDAKKTALNTLNKELEAAKKLATAGAITTAFKSADTEINSLKTAQADFIQAYNEEKNKIEEAEKEEAKNKAEGIKKVKDEQEKIKNALDALATATASLNNNAILNVNVVKTAKEELDKHKKALTDLNSALEKAKNSGTAADITAAFNNVGSSADKITELKDAQEAFINAYKLQETVFKEAVAKRERINNAITKIQEKDLNKNTLDNAVKDINNHFSSVDKYESFFNNIKNSTSAQRSTVMNNLDNFLRKPLAGTFTENQKNLAKKIVIKFRLENIKDNDENKIYDELSKLDEYKTLSEDNRKKMAEDISKELYENNKRFFTDAFKKVLNSGINDIFPNVTDDKFYETLKNDLAFDAKQYIQHHANTDDINKILTIIGNAKDYESDFALNLVFNIMNHARYTDITNNMSLDKNNKIDLLNRGITVNNIFNTYFEALKVEKDESKITTIKKIINLLLSSGKSSANNLRFNDLINQDNIATLFNTLDKSIIKEYLINNTNIYTKKDIFENVDDPKIVKNLVDALKYVGLPEKRYDDNQKIDIASDVIRTKIDNLITNYTNENKEDTKQALKILFKSIDKFVENDQEAKSANKLSLAKLLGEILTTNTDRTEFYTFLNSLYEKDKNGIKYNPYYWSIRVFLDAMIHMFANRANTGAVALNNDDTELIRHIIQNQDSKDKAKSLINKYPNKNNMNNILEYINNLKF